MVPTYGAPGSTALMTSPDAAAGVERILPPGTDVPKDVAARSLSTSSAASPAAGPRTSPARPSSPSANATPSHHRAPPRNTRPRHPGARSSSTAPATSTSTWARTSNATSPTSWPSSHATCPSSEPGLHTTPIPKDYHAPLQPRRPHRTAHRLHRRPRHGPRTLLARTRRQPGPPRPRRRPRTPTGRRPRTADRRPGLGRRRTRSRQPPVGGRRRRRALRPPRRRHRGRRNRIHGPLETLDPELWERVIDINLSGAWRTFRATLPHVKQTKGYLLAISSMAAFVHSPLNGPYVASKAGLWALCDATRLELRHEKVAVGSAHRPSSKPR